MKVEAGQLPKVNASEIAKRKANEEKRLREMTIPKKQKRLYDKIQFTQKKKRQEVKRADSRIKMMIDWFQVEKLKRKRAEYEKKSKPETNGKSKHMKMS